jgi:hypothetical protein
MDALSDAAMDPLSDVLSLLKRKRLRNAPVGSGRFVIDSVYERRVWSSRTSWPSGDRSGLSTLTRYLKRQKDRESPAGGQSVEQRRLVSVELTAAVTISASAFRRQRSAEMELCRGTAAVWDGLSFAVARQRSAIKLRTFATAEVDQRNQKSTARLNCHCLSIAEITSIESIGA